MHESSLRSPTQGALHRVLPVLGWATAWLLVGFVLRVPLGVPLLVDLFTTAERIRVVNAETHALDARSG